MTEPALDVDPDEEPEGEDNPTGGEIDRLERLGLPESFYRGALVPSLAHIAAATPLAGVPAWRELGPRNIGGRIRDLVQAPLAANTLYAGSAFGGVWRTPDGGGSWQVVGGPADAMPVGALAITPDGARLYVGSGEPVSGHVPGRGLFQVTLVADPAAAVWTPLADVPDPPVPPAAVQPSPASLPLPKLADRYARIVVDPTAPDRFWAASNTGLWRREGDRFIDDVVGDKKDVTDVALAANTAAGGGLVLYVAIRDEGVYSFTFTGGQASGWRKLKSLDHRIRLAVCREAPQHVFALAVDDHNFAGSVLHSADHGDSWDKGAPVPKEHEAEKSGQASYSMVLAVHPTAPNVVFAGEVDLFRSLDFGRNWTRVIDWRDEDENPAKHADQHAIVFDPHRTHALWVANDGGVSESADLGHTWRKRSYGLIAAQFNDVTTHPRFPFLMGGGLQDNGTFLGYGGASWYSVGGGDGGMMAFDPQNVRRLYTTTQKRISAVDVGEGTDRAPLPDLGPGVRLETASREIEEGFAEANRAPFVGVVEHHPVQSNHLLVGRRGGGFLGTLPAGGGEITFARLQADLHPETAQVSTVAYALDDPDHRWWLGTSKGEVFQTRDGNATPWTAMHPGFAGTPFVSRIVVHPADHQRVAVATSAAPGGENVPSPGRVFLTLDEGAHWFDVSGRPPGTPSPEADTLPPSPISALAFDPGPGVERLYAATLVGVYALDLAGIAPDTVPAWRSLPGNLPRVLVTDLAFVAGTRRLRCSTFGRGMFEVDLGAAPIPAGTPPPTRIFLRQHAVEDGLTYPRDPALSTRTDGDPRTSPGTNALDLDVNNEDAYQAFDLRLQAPPFDAVSPGNPLPVPILTAGRIDPAELDLALASESARPGVVNLVFVQAHSLEAPGAPAGPAAPPAIVEIHLYRAPRAQAAPFHPPLPAGLPGAPPAGPWAEIGPAQTVPLRPGAHGVVRFPWTPAAGDLGEVVLLALATTPDDALTTGPTDLRALLIAERRAAARVVNVRPELAIRNAVDDDGTTGAVAWGGRSPDIVVTQNPANPAADFVDLGDREPGQPLRAGANRVYVRVHNRSAVPVSVLVDLYFAPLDAPWTWPSHRITAAQGVPVTDIPPRGALFTAEIPWTPPAAQPHLLVAVVRHALLDDPSLPALPAAGTQDFHGFWAWFADRRNTQGRVAARALRFAS
jgi:photosystem II stability/assembly factor-like uncharacterized protein